MGGRGACLKDTHTDKNKHKNKHKDKNKDKNNNRRLSCEAG